LRHAIAPHGHTLYVLVIAHEDFSVVVRRDEPTPKPWRWEIYRADRKSAIQRLKNFFETATETDRAGKAALASLLSECPDQQPIVS
jgi:hypothetical protein